MRIFLLFVVAMVMPAVLLADDAPRPGKPGHPTIAAERRIWIQGVERADTQQLLLERALSDEKVLAILGIDSNMARKITRMRVDEDFPVGGPLDPNPDKRRVAEHFVLRVQLADAGEALPQKADEYLEAVVTQFRWEIRDAWQRQPRIMRAHDSALEAEKDWMNATAQIRDLRKEVAQLTGRLVDGTAAETRAAWARMDQERETLEMERVGKRARQEAVVQAMKEVSADLSGRAEKDAVAEELQKVVKAREDGYERAKKLFEAKDVSESEVDDARSKVAEARARLLERRDSVVERNGGTILVDLNRELQSVVVTVAEAEARLKAAKEILAKFDTARGALEQLQQLEGEREQQAQALARARDALAKTLQDNPPPQLIVKLSSSEAAKDK
jgi:hypothetical protein